MADVLSASPWAARVTGVTFGRIRITFTPN